MFFTMIIVSVAILALAVLGLGFSIFFRKNGKFPETGVGHNPEMRKLGLSCAKADELRRFQLQRDIGNAKRKQPAGGLQDSTACAGCGCSSDI